MSVAVIVLSWNRREFTLRCLDSVFRQAHSRVSVLLVDNGSSDGTVGAVRSLYPRVAVIENGRNLGYAEGNNAGLRRALGMEADYFLIVNNDVQLGPEAVPILVRESERSARFGIAGPAMSVPAAPDSASFWQRLYWTRSQGSGKFFASIRQAGEVPWVPGSCMLIKRKVVETIGFLDPAFFAYGEDRDYCMRAREAGFAVIYAPQASIGHHESASTGGILRDSPLKNYLLGRNEVLLVRKRGSRAQYARCLARIPFKCLTLLLGCWARPRPRSAWARVRGFYDGLIQQPDARPRFPAWVCATDPWGCPRA